MGKDFVEWFLKESKGEFRSFCSGGHHAAACLRMWHDMWWAMQRRQVSLRGRRTAAIRQFWRMTTPMPWAEVYQEGIGWTVVEATPGFAAPVTESDGASGQKEKEADSPDT